MDEKNFLSKVKGKIKNGWNAYGEATRNMAVETLEYEYGEMENIFGLLVLGAFVGFPSPPMQITLDLLPEMEKHFRIMLNKVDVAESPLSDLLSAFDVI
ncbi:MAG: hypothetical protein GXO87_00600 [Chlorobi bacterium]|nr:hypothetical protein [Chlorobiota bacterium]